MKHPLTLLTVLLLGPQNLVHAGDVPTPAGKPNILLIVADDLGWSDVGWHGGFGKTPSLDSLVRQGVELDQHYVQPVCTPTRAALMSGRYPGRFGPQALSPSNLRAMPLGTVTIASALKSFGYNTHQAGKWHLGARPEWIPNAYGFDTSYGTLTGAADPWTHKYRKGNPYEDTWHRDGKFFHEEGNATELIAAKPGESSLRFGDWKLLARKQDKHELFNIAADPYEKENRAAKQPETLAELRTLLAKEQSRDNPVLPADLKDLPH